MCRVLPGTHIRISGTRIDNLVLDYDVLASVVLEVLDIEDLGVRIVVHSSHCGVCRVGHIDDVHLRPACDVGVGIPIGRVSYLYLGITGCGELIERDRLDVLGVHHVLTGIPVVMLLILEQRVKHRSAQDFRFIGIANQHEGSRSCN